MTFPAAGSATDLALLLVDHHGASLIVSAGHLGEHRGILRPFRAQSNPSTFLTRLKVGRSSSTPKPLRRCTAATSPVARWRCWCWRCSGGHRRTVGLRTDAVVLEWLTNYWHRLTVWVQGWMT